MRHIQEAIDNIDAYLSAHKNHLLPSDMTGILTTRAKLVDLNQRGEE